MLKPILSITSSQFQKNEQYYKYNWINMNSISYLSTYLVKYVLKYNNISSEYDLSMYLTKYVLIT